MRTIEQTFQQLTALISDQTRDLALAMAELASVAQQRDDFAEALQRNCAEYVQKQQALIAERDALRAERDNLWQQRDAMQGVMKTLAAERDTARQSLRASEQDLAETCQVNSDLRGVNKRLVADLAAAMERAETAEAILRAKA